MECKFCRDYFWLRNNIRQSRAEIRSRQYKFKGELSVTLVKESFNKKQRCGRVSMGKYPIKFCPICGK